MLGGLRVILLDVCGAPDLLHFELSGLGIASAALRTLLHASAVLVKSPCILADFCACGMVDGEGEPYCQLGRSAG